MRATEIAKDAIARVLGPGDIAIDATAGNGHDTLFLCETVGHQGRVIGFDVQEQALASTRERLEMASIPPQSYRLAHASHEDIGKHAEPASVTAIMFNLGYLPGGDKAVVTRKDTTLAALDVALPLVRPGGVLTIVCYPGHGGGDEEAEAVTAWAKALVSPWQADIHEPAKPGGPFAVVVRKVA